MLKRRILAILVLMGTIPVIFINNDITVTVLVSVFALPIVFEKKKKEEKEWREKNI